MSFSDGLNHRHAIARLTGEDWKKKIVVYGD
jgi:hypothetical protein